MRGLFVTGTDTGIGKTYAACLIARQLRRDGHRVGCYKPVCTGCERRDDGSRYWDDIEALSAALGDEFPKHRIGPQTFDAPLAPPAAARLEGGEVDAVLMRRGADWWSDCVDVLLVEGVGGLLCPIASGETVADLAGELGFPLLIVAPLKLGTINHTLLTIEVAEHRGLSVAGILWNDINRRADKGQSDELLNSTLTETAALTSVPQAGILTHAATDHLRPLPDTLAINWMELAQPAKCPGATVSK